MNNNIQAKLLTSIIRSKGHAELTVNGFSMHPTLYEGDCITIVACNFYDIGDILVYNYKNEGILVHRLLKKDKRYYCKGDNAFRMEDIEPDQIIGKVISVNSLAIEPWPAWKIQFSYDINRKFHECHYDIALTKQSDIYKLYSTSILQENNMLCQEREKIDLIKREHTMNKEKILELLGNIIHIDKKVLLTMPEDTKLSDIGLSSLTFIQFIVSLEDEFSIEVLDSDLILSNFQTLQLLFSTLQKYFQTDTGLKKVIICDCDNCLWHGVAGEENIYIDDAITALQNELIYLQKKGVLLCLCSKNEPLNISRAFAQLDMPLKEEHILLSIINRNNKADNICRIASELNLSTDSFLFLDDSDYELGLINALLPEVTTLKVAYDESNLSLLLQQLHSYFSQDASIQDRTKLYREQKEREKIKLKFDNVESYNDSLNTIITCEISSHKQAKRIAELSMRTNQCNLSCARYTTEEILSMLNSKEYTLLSLSAKDKFGDMGLVGSAVIKHSSSPIIEALFLSCRAFDRGFESVLIETAKRLFPTGLKGIYKESDLNKRFCILYQDHGVLPYEEL